MPSAEDPARSRAEQPGAVPAYHEALAALDDALRQLAATPYAGNFQAPEPGAPRGWRQRLSAFAWRRVPLLRQQRDVQRGTRGNADPLRQPAYAVRRHPNRELSAALSKLAEDAAAAPRHDGRRVLGRPCQAGTGCLRRHAVSWPTMRQRPATRWPASSRPGSASWARMPPPRAASSHRTWLRISRPASTSWHRMPPPHAARSHRTWLRISRRPRQAGPGCLRRARQARTGPG